MAHAANANSRRPPTTAQLTGHRRKVKKRRNGSWLSVIKRRDAAAQFSVPFED